MTVPVLREELLLLTMPTHPLAKKKKILPEDLASEPFVLFEAGSATRRVIDSFFITEKVEPTVVMDTENVEIIKAMVRAGLGIGIVPYQAIAREVRAKQFFCARIEGHELVRETGWVYSRADRVPRMIGELLTAFDEVRGRLRLTRRGGNCKNAVWTLRAFGKLQREHGEPGTTAHRDLSAVALDDRLDDRQSEPAAARLSRPFADGP